MKSIIENMAATYVMANQRYASDSDIYKTLNKIFDGKNYVVDVEDPLYENNTEAFNAVWFSKNGRKRPRQSNSKHEDHVIVNFIGFYFYKSENSHKYDSCLVSFPQYTSFYLDNQELTKEEKEYLLDSYVQRLSFMLSKYSEALEIGDDLYRMTVSDEGNPLAFAMKFFKTYMERGLYKEKHTVDSRTTGKTSWTKTINRITPDISNDQVIYSSVIKEKNVRKITDVSALQIAILKHYLDMGFYNMIEFMYKGNIVQNLQKLHSNLDIEKICNNEIERRRWLQNVQNIRRGTFNSADVEILDLIIHFLKQEDFASYGSTNIYGVMKFDRIFEAALADYFGNNIKIHKQSAKDSRTIVEYKSTTYPIKKTKPQKYVKDTRIDVSEALFDSVKYDIYYTEGDANHLKVKNELRKDDTGNLIPDIVFEKQIESGYCAGDYVVILDAKYRDYYPGRVIEDEEFAKDHPDIPTIELCSMPQKHDIIKQFQYETAIKQIYQDRLQTDGKDIKFINALILPWNRKYDQADYDGENLANGLNVFKVIGCAKLEDQIVLYILVNFDAIADYLTFNVKAKETEHDICLIEAASYYLFQTYPKDGDHNE